MSCLIHSSMVSPICFLVPFSSLCAQTMGLQLLMNFRNNTTSPPSGKMAISCSLSLVEVSQHTSSLLCWNQLWKAYAAWRFS